MAIKFLSGLNLSDVTAGSLLKLDSNGNIVAATAGTDYATSSVWTEPNSGTLYTNKKVGIGYSDAAAKLHVYEYQTTTPKLLIEDGNTGDASMQFKISTQSYTMGIDNSDSDKFVLAASSALGTTNVLEVAAGGTASFQNNVLVNGTIYADAGDISGRLDVASDLRIRGNSSNNDLGVVRFYADNGNHLYIDTGNNGTQITKFGADGSLTIASSATQGLTIKQDAQLGADMQVEIRGSRNAPGVGVNPAKLILSSYDSDDGSGVVKTGAEFYMESTDLTGGDLTDFEVGLRYRKDGAVVDGISIHDGEVKAHGSLITKGSIDTRVGNAEFDTTQLLFNAYNGASTNDSNDIGTGIVWRPNYTGYTKRSAGVMQIAEGNYFKSGLAFYTNNTSDNSTDWSERMRISKEGYVGIGTTGPSSILELSSTTPPVLTLTHDGTNPSTNELLSSIDFNVDYDGGHQNWGKIELKTNASSVRTDMRFYVKSTSGNLQEALLLQGGSANPKAFFTNAVDVNGSITGSTLYTEGSVINSSLALELRSDVQHGQGDEDAVISFKQSTNELAKIDQYGYVYATGFKVGSGSGVLRADGSTETITFGTMASASTGDYKTSDATETYVGQELGSYTPTSSFGTNAFTSYTDHSTQGYLTASSTDLDSRYYTETELTNFFKSVTHQGNYISTANWSNDGSGSVASGWSAEGFPFDPTGAFVQNGSGAENTRTVAELPNGAYGVVWRTPSNDADSGADGGWDMDIYNVQHAKAYRSVVYFQKTDDSTSGTFYHGCHGSHTLAMNGSANTNPYFQTVSFSNLVQGRWYVSVGYIQPYQYPTATDSTRSGIYDCYTGKKIVGGVDYMMKSGSTTQRHRTYQYYSTDPSSSINWWNPRFEEINGNEPSLAELIQRVGVDGELGLNFHSKFPAGALGSLTEATDATNDKILLWDESADEWKQMTLEDLQDSIDQNTTYSVATTSANGLMSSTDKTKLDGIASGAEVNVQSDWNATTGDSFIKNKPTLGTASASAATDFVAVSGDTMTGTLALNNEDSLSFESGKHWITYNDGEGNFNIRVGHKSDGTPNEVSTETGYAFHDEWSQGSGWREFNVSGTSITAGNDVGTWRRQMYYDYNDVRLSYQGGLKFQTTNTGITVTGEIVTTGGNSTNWSTAYTYSQVGHLPLSGGSLTGDVSSNSVITADVLRLTNDATDTSRHRVAVYDSGSTSYGMMLWNASGTSSDWATMIYGPNQDNRRISFGKINSDTFTSHGDVTEIAHFDLDDKSLNLDGALNTNTINVGSIVTLTESTDRADLLYINSGTSSWGGLQIGNTSNEFIFSLMGNGDEGGIYDDANSDWMIRWYENAGVQLNYNASEKIITTSQGVRITGATSGTASANRGFAIPKSGLGAIHVTGAQGGASGSADTVPLITFPGSSNVTTEAQGGIYLSQNSSTGTSVAIATTDSYSNGPKLSLEVYDNGNVNISRGKLFIGSVASTTGTEALMLVSGEVKSRTLGSNAFNSTAYLEDITPATPSVDSATVVGETIEITFSESSTPGVDYYQVWSAVGSSTGSYGMIAHIPQEDVASSMTVIDATFNVSDTMYYRVYAVKSGIYSTAGTANRAFSASALDVANMSVVNLNTAYYIQYEMPDSRFVDHVEIYMDAEATASNLTRTGATLVYSGNNTSYMYKIGANDLDKYHQFWVEVVES